MALSSRGLQGPTCFTTTDKTPKVQKELKGKEQAQSPRNPNEIQKLEVLSFKYCKYLKATCYKQMAS